MLQKHYGVPADPDFYFIYFLQYIFFTNILSYFFIPLQQNSQFIDFEMPDTEFYYKMKKFVRDSYPKLTVKLLTQKIPTL